MASKQDGIVIQMNNTNIDKWSVREQLCLASAISSGEDHDWNTISCTLQLLCGDNKRPNDWFSKQNCESQYSHILEELNINEKLCINSTKPKIITTETHAEVLKYLTDKRVQELRANIKKEQQEYAKLYADIKAAQTNQLNNEQLLEMWNDIEKEQEMKRVEEMKLENQLREREERKRELKNNWHNNSTNLKITSTTDATKSPTNTKPDKINVEELCTPKSLLINNATSPLLSSLLKSSCAGNNSINSTCSSVRTTAPTITTLLTGGSIPNTNQPAIIPSHGDAIELLTRPISGPPNDNVSNMQNLLSPSQSAPTLSMLLEKNKSIINNTVTNTTTNKPLLENVNASSSLTDANNEPIPMDIEEDVHPNKVRDETPPAVVLGGGENTDLNEEQQLLEVFKNIGNIDELDIDVAAVIDDEEVDFLKEVDANPPTTDAIEMDKIKTEDDAKIKPTIRTESSTEAEETKTEIQDNVSINKEITTKIEIISSDDSTDNIPLSTVASIESFKERVSNSENTLDESTFLKLNETNENIQPDIKDVETCEIKSTDCAETAIVEGETEYEKLESIKSESCESTDKYETIIIKEELQKEENETTIKSEVHNENENNDENNTAIENKPLEPNTVDESENDTFIITAQTTTEDIKENVKQETEMEPIVSESSANIKMKAPPTFSVGDTDDDSCTTDASISTRKDEKQNVVVSKLQRKSPLEIKTEDELRNPIDLMVTPSYITVRSSSLRKLRERDGSESPLVDDDGTNASDHSTNQRLRRRFSSTPVIDSIPNSPASSDRDERELRVSKKSLLSIFNVLNSNKNAVMLQRILKEESLTRKFQEICLRPIDLHTIKRNIEFGNIRTVYELQRDILLMCQNALMVTKVNSTNQKVILMFQRECQSIREFMSNNCGDSILKNEGEIKTNSSSSVTSSAATKNRSGSRKSLRIS